MSPRFTLRCLGAGELRTPGGDPIRFRTRKHLALLIYLAVEPRRTHRRDRLAELLWPAASAGEARHSVATALSVLRGKLGPSAFEAGRDQVRFACSDLELDLDRLARGEVLGDEFTPPLEVGGFLDGLEVLGAPDFMLWREQQRARWLPAIRDAAIRLMDHCRRTGNTRRIELVADSLLALDELSEDAVRAKMEARALAGDRVGALRIFEHWRLRLAEELGAMPAPPLENLANRLRRRGWEGGSPPAIPAPQTDQWRNQIFVGRASEYRVLYENWERTLRHQPRHVIVLGDSGIGKTTIVERLVTAASLEGAVSVRSHCYEIERQIPYAAIGTLVRSLLDRPGAAATAPEHLSELTRAVAEVRVRFPNLPPPRESQGETARLLLTDAVHQLASSVAEECPLILVVDDVHLADDASVAVLHLLMRRTQEQRILVVLTARQAELGHSPHTSRLLETRCALGLEALTLPPLSDEESAELVEHLAGDASPAPAPPVRRALVQAAAGNPMVLELLFRDWRENGSDCLALAISAMTLDPGPRSHEDTYRALLERFFHDLDPASRGVLNLASILGTRMNDLRMYELVDLSLGQTMAGLARLADLRLLRDGGTNLEFRNEVIRAYAYLDVPSPLRRALHGLVADRLLLAAEQGESVAGLELAWHCVRAGREGEATPHLLRGAREALEHGAPFEVERALHVFLPRLEGEAREQGTILLAESLEEQDRAVEAIRLLQTAVPTPDTERELLLTRASLVGRTGASAEDLKSMRAALQDSLERDERPGDRARVAVAFSRIAPWLGGRAEAAEILKDVESISIDTLSPIASAHFHCAKARLAYLAGRKDFLVSEQAALAAIAQQLEGGGIRSGVTYAVLAHLASIAITLGDYQSAMQCAEAGLREAKARGNDYERVRQGVNIALALCRLGRYREQGDMALSLLPAAKGGRDFVLLCKGVYYTAIAKAFLGDPSAAVDILRREMPEAPHGAAPWVLQAHGFLSADILLLSGRFREARTCGAQALTLSAHEPLSEQYRGTFARWLALAGGELFSHTEIMENLTSMARQKETLDLADRAEVFAAIGWLGRGRGEDVASAQEELQRCLAVLPPAVKYQLDRLLPTT